MRTSLLAALLMQGLRCPEEQARERRQGNQAKGIVKRSQSNSCNDAYSEERSTQTSQPMICVLAEGSEAVNGFK